MEYAKLTLAPTSPFITPLQSDTIFGHFAWGILFVFGEDRLKEFLKDFETNPFIIFSDGFEKGKLPKPLLKPYLPTDEELKYAKEIKKKALIEKEFLFENINKLSDKKIFDYFKNRLKQKRSYTPCDIEQNTRYKSENEELSNIKDAITQKNSINRNSNIVNEGLYSIKERFFMDKQYEIYFAYQSISKEEIEKVFEFISRRGYGKDKSAGKGRFDFDIDWDFEDKRFFMKKKKFFINLSTMFLSNNMHLLYGKTITKFPRTGGYYANSQPYKNPSILYLPGSTFIVDKEPFGEANDRVFNKENHYHSGYSIGIYFDEVNDEK